MKVELTRENLFCAWIFSATVAVLLLLGDIGCFPMTAFMAAFLGFFFLKIHGGRSMSFSYLAAPSVFILAYIAMMVFPALFVFEEMHHPIRYTYLMAVLSVLISFPIGVRIANAFNGHPGQILIQFFESNPANVARDTQFLTLFKLGVLSSVPILLVFFRYSTHVQLWEVIKQYPTPVEKVALRFSANELPLAVQFSYEILRRMILPWCVLYAFFRSRPRVGRWIIIYRSLFVYALIVCTLSLDRAPVFGLIAMLIMARALANNWSIMALATSFKTLIWIGVLGAAGGLISILQYQSAILWETFTYNFRYVLWYRTILDPAFMAAYYSFTVFDNPSEFLFGRDIRLFSIFGFKYVDSLYGIGDLRNTVAPVTFVGDLWRNWGWIGVVLGTIILGMVLQSLQLRLCERAGPASLSLQVILLINSVYLIHGNALGVMSTCIFIMIFIATFFLPKALNSRMAL